MSKRFSWAAALIFCALPVVGMSSFEDPLLKESDHKKLGSKIQGWIEARVAKEGSDKAAEDFRNALGKWAKKKPAAGRDPLSLTEDLGRALWFSYDYTKVSKKAVKGKVKDVEVPYRRRTVSYTVYAPKKFSAKTAYPLLLMVTEFGEKPFDYVTEEWALPELKDGAILVCVHMPADKDDWNLIQTEDKELGGVGSILTTLGAVVSSYPVDFDKVFLVGRLEGLQAVMTAANQFPDRFAGVIGRTGDFKDIGAENFRNLPTFFAGGGEGATKFKESIDAAKYENCTVAPAAKEEDIWSWVQETTRVANPTEVTLRPGVPFPNSAYWLRMPAWDGEGEARLHGKVNREENSIVVEGRGMSSVTISFNDLMLDLSKPVKVVCNGVETVELIPRSWETTLTNVYSARSDPGKLYVATRRYGIVDPGADESGEDE